MERTNARERFAAAVARERDDDIDLAHAALCIAAEERRDLDVEAYVRRLDALAGQVAPPLAAFRAPADALATLRELFARERLRGNAADYYDPRNSYLDQVLDRGLGIPITLSLVYLEVGWRCGLPLAGVGFPGHFLVKYVEPGGEHYVDPFEGARTVSLGELRTRVAALLGGRSALLPQHLAAVSRRQILVRINQNLKAIFSERGDLARALAAVERNLLLMPDAAAEIRDRGLLQLGLRAFARGAGDLERYLALVPDAPDAAAVRQHLERAARERVRLN